MWRALANNILVKILRTIIKFIIEKEETKTKKIKKQGEKKDDKL